MQAIAALRRLRFTGPEIAEILGMALSTVSGILTRIGMGRLGRLGLEPARALRERLARGADPHRRQEARPDREQAPASESPAEVKRNPKRTRTDAAGVESQGHRLGVRPHRDRRLHAARIRRAADRREGHDRDRLPAPRDRLLRTPRREGRTTAYGQWRRLPLGGARDRLPRAGDPPPAHPPLPTADQRQGGALHPHPARRLGLLRRSIAPAQSAPQHLTDGSGITTISADTRLSATNRRSLGSPRGDIVRTSHRNFGNPRPTGGRGLTKFGGRRGLPLPTWFSRRCGARSYLRREAFETNWLIVW